MQKKYDYVTATFIAQLVRSIPPISLNAMNYWMSHTHQLEAFLGGLANPKNEFMLAWRSVALGTGLRTGQQFIEAMEREGFIVTKSAKIVLLEVDPYNSKFLAGNIHKKIWLTMLTPRDLGFTKPRSADDICTKALTLGFELCPIELGPQLRLQYPNQPVGEKIAIGMQSYTTRKDALQRFFVVKHTSHGQELDCCFANAVNGKPPHLWDVDSKWVFVHFNVT